MPKIAPENCSFNTVYRIMDEHHLDTGYTLNVHGAFRRRSGG